MKIGTEEIFNQIVRTNIDDLGDRKLKDVRLDLKEEYEYDRSKGYVGSYEYLCRCLLIDVS